MSFVMTMGWVLEKLLAIRFIVQCNGNVKHISALRVFLSIMDNQRSRVAACLITVLTVIIGQGGLRSMK